MTALRVWLAARRFAHLYPLIVQQRSVADGIAATGGVR